MGKLDPLETQRIHGSNQQNIIKPTNHKKIGLFLVGIFEIGEEHNKIKLENKEGRLQIRDKPKL